jgi:RNA polymerase sigma factor (sigma-70 family)
MRITSATSQVADDRSDAELLTASGESPELFGRLFDRHVDSIFGYVRKRVGPEMAEEVTAETFAQAFGGRERYVPVHESAAPWLYGIATNVIHRARRAERRQLEAYGKAAAVVTPGPDDFDEADSRLDAHSAAGALVEALLALASGDRDALLLFAWEGLSYDDVATAMGIPPGTVASRINRARRHIRARLDSTDDSMGAQP